MDVRAIVGEVASIETGALIVNLFEGVTQPSGATGAVDSALDNLHEVPVPDKVTATRTRPPRVPEDAPDFVQKVTRLLLEGQGDKLPVSAFPPDGTWPTGTICSRAVEDWLHWSVP